MSMDDYYNPWTEKEFFKSNPDATYADWLLNKKFEEIMMNPAVEIGPNWWEMLLFRFYIFLTNDYQDFIFDHYETEEAQRISGIWVELQELEPFKNKYFNRVVQGIVLKIKVIFH